MQDNINLSLSHTHNIFQLNLVVYFLNSYFIIWECTEFVGTNWDSRLGGGEGGAGWNALAS